MILAEQNDALSTYRQAFPYLFDEDGEPLDKSEIKAQTKDLKLKME